MSDITLTKDQITKLFAIYNQFRYIDDYTLTLSSEGTVSVKFEMNKVEKNGKKFVEETFR